MQKTIFPLLISLFLLPLSLSAQTKDHGAYDPELGNAIKGLGKKHALVIGINDYPGRRLAWAVQDARAIGALLRDRYGFDVEELTSPKDTTKASIEDAFGRLVGKAGADDQVIIFFSGHGDAIKRGNRITGGFLVPINGDRERFSTLIPMTYIQFMSNSLAARHVLFIIDTCYSAIAGGMTHMGDLPEETASFVKAKMEKRGRQIMTAGKSDQKARMLDDLQMSVYSYYLKKALEGAADANKDHVVTLAEVQAYVEKEVAAKTKNRQEPLWRHLEDTGDAGEFVFVPRDFEEWAHKQRQWQPPLIPYPDRGSEAGAPGAVPVPGRSVELKDAKNQIV